EPPDAVQGNRVHPGWFNVGGRRGGHRHGLAELRLLVPGRAEPDLRGGGAGDDLVGLRLASAIFHSSQRHTAYAPFWRQPYGWSVFLFDCTRAGRAADR